MRASCEPSAAPHTIPAPPPLAFIDERVCHAPSPLWALVLSLLLAALVFLLRPGAEARRIAEARREYSALDNKL